MLAGAGAARGFSSLTRGLMSSTSCLTSTGRGTHTGAVGAAVTFTTDEPNEDLECRMKIFILKLRVVVAYLRT